MGTCARRSSSDEKQFTGTWEVYNNSSERHVMKCIAFLHLSYVTQSQPQTHHQDSPTSIKLFPVPCSLFPVPPHCLHFLWYPPHNPTHNANHSIFANKGMASLGSLPFLLEAPHAASKRRTPVAYSSGIVWKVRSLRVGGRGSLVGHCTVRRGGGKDGSFEGDHDDGVEDGVIPESTEKSKKVLSMHNNLPQQIAEWRKIMSLGKNSVVNTDKDAVSYNESDYNSFPTADLSLTSGEFNGKYSNNITSDSSEPKTAVSETPPVSINGGFPNEMKDPEDSTKIEKSVADDHSSSRDVSVEEAPPSVLPPILPKASDTYVVKDQVVEDMPEATVDNVGVELHGAAEEETIVPPPLAGANVMNIILLAVECAPWSKTGGLGDVAGALPKALARRGHRVMVVTPRYGNYSEPQYTGVHKRYRVDGQDMEVTYFHAYIDGVDFVFLDIPVFRHRDNNIYGGERLDILKRMVLFCKAAVEVCWHVPCGGVCYGDGNLVFIANDWHTALVPVYLKASYRDNGLMMYARSVLVIHNIAHQGRGPVEDFPYVDLPNHYMDLFKLYDPIGGDHFNLFAAGLRTADRVVTVSHGYAWELKTSEGGWGLHGIINENVWKFQGIVNGIDTKDWNPELDVHLKSDGYTNYSLETLKTGKAQCKAALQKELGLPVRPEVPIISFIGRLDYQKGVDLIAEAMPWIVGQDVQVVMLGTGRPDLENMLRSFESQHHDKVRAWVGFSVNMAHRITAGADILIMPSRFEPCGLNQLYAMMYGTVPVVHAVGGLRDTVIQFDPYKETGYGWTFERAESSRLIDALGNCLNTYCNYKNSWEGLQRRGMMQDLSWDNAAQQYEEVLVAAKHQW